MTLDELGARILQDYKDIVTSKGKIASGGLLNATYDVEVDDGTYRVFLNVPYYYDYVENGRGPGKFPPVDKIKKWIEIKPIVPYSDKYGKVPTTNQLAFLISRKISEEGIPPVPLLKETLENQSKSAIDEFVSSLMEEIANQVFESE